MKIRAQIGMVLNLDKCIGCHTCSVTCKQVWTNRPGVEYVWFNNVESKPGVGYPLQWENQEKWKGGWIRKKDGSLQPRQGNKHGILKNIFGNPSMPNIKDYYEPFTFDYGHLQSAKESKASPVARPISLLTGKTMEKIESGPNWEDDLGGPAKERHLDPNFKNIDSTNYEQFETSFLAYLPRLCEHCINPTCIASCPEGSIYKREEDGIVLVDQDKCKGWRMCVSGCPYKKIYFNHKTGKAEKCLFCYPRIESGQPTVCAETCVGRMRYLGVLLYDADRIEAAAAVQDEKDLLAAQLSIFLDPNDPEVIRQAQLEGIPDSWLEAAKSSPVYSLAVKWQLALPLHPEYRTLPMVWYVPPLSPLQGNAQKSRNGVEDVIPNLEDGRIPVQYLANLLAAGDVEPVKASLQKLIAIRKWFRDKNLKKGNNLSELNLQGLTEYDVNALYQLLAIANYEDRFVLPTSHREYAENSFGMEGPLGRAEVPGCSFSDGQGCNGPTGDTKPGFGGFK